jgi:hypothetical protein
MHEGEGNIMVAIAMFGWIPLVRMLFRKFEPRLAIAVAFVGGWMFLPVAGFKVPGIPAYNKMTATCMVILFWARKFDRQRYDRFNLSPIDLPMLLWCISPFFSSLFNDLGVYDGLSQTMYQSITWGVPYLIGRVWFNDAEGLKLLGTAIFIGTVVYIPLCWFELIMSPQLHRMIYGFHQHNFLQTLRDGGGFRPMLFMDHGLMTASWMSLGVFLGSWMLYTGQLPGKIASLPSRYLYMALVVTFLMMKSYGAIVLVFLGLVILYISNRSKSGFLMMILLLLPLLYVYTRTTGVWDGRNLSGFVEEKFSPTRAQSLQFRFDNEYILIKKALQGTPFGWGGYGRSRVFDEHGRDISITDGLWIITLGQNGPVGLMNLIMSLLLPVFLFLRRFRPERWNEQTLAVPAVMAIFLATYMIDNLLNAMINPVYMVFTGGLAYLSSGIPEQSPVMLLKAPEGIVAMAGPTTHFITAPSGRPTRFID